MSDKELLENEQLDEFKASHGDSSEVPEPTGKEAPKPAGSKDVEDDPKDAPTAVKAPGTKAAMINAMMTKVNGMKSKELKASYGKIMSAMQCEEVEAEAEEIEASTEIPLVTAKDINVSEDVAEMFAGQDLSEDFQEKVTTVFEAAVVAKVNEQLNLLSGNIEAEINEEVESIKAEMAENLGKHTDYVVEQWMEENRLAVEQGLKAEMVENFMAGLKDLFEEHYVDLPEEKVDVVEELATKTEELEATLNEQIERNASLNAELESFKRDALIEGVSEDLTESQKAKFKTLAEGIDYTDEETFIDKINVVKESYFGIVEDTTVSYEFDEAEPLEEEVKPSTGTMSAYVNAISRSIKK